MACGRFRSVVPIVIMALALASCGAVIPETSYEGVSTPALSGLFTEGTVTLSDAEGTERSFPVEVAATPQAHARGLMFRPEVTTGMLFVFDREERRSFWMKNTLVPLDILWIGPDKKLTVIHEKLRASTVDTPDDKIVTAGGQGQFVLELASGEASRRGLKAGDQLKFTAAIPDK